MLILDSLIFYLIAITLVITSVFACFIKNLYYSCVFLYIFLFCLSFISFAAKAQLNGILSILSGCICLTLLIMFTLFNLKNFKIEKSKLNLKKKNIFVPFFVILFLTSLTYILTKLNHINIFETKIQSIGVETITTVSNSLCIRYFILYLIIPIIFLIVLTGVFMMFYKKKHKPKQSL